MMKHIEKAVNDYLEIKETTYSLLIDGSWGTGKTFFIQNKLMRNIEVKKYNSLNDTSISKNIKTIMYKPIYVSLFGLESISDLEKEIFLSIKPRVKSKRNLINTGSQIGNFILNIVAAFGYRTGNNNVDIQPFIKAWMGMKSEMLLIFDDLERCKINYVELFGFINKFIEQDKIKTIFITDEKQIIRTIDAKRNRKDTRSDTVEDINIQEYKRFKEKVIGKTLKFFPDEEISILSLIEKYRFQDNYYNFLNSNMKLISNIFIKTVDKNLRSLNQALSDFHFIYQQLNKMEKEHLEYAAEKLLKYTIAFTSEIRSGKYNNEQLLSMKKLKITSELVGLINGKSKKNHQDQEIIFSDIFVSKYYDETSSSLIGYASITEYLITGYFDEVQFTTETKLPEILEKSPEVKLFEKYYEMSQQEFNECYSATLQRIKKGKLGTAYLDEFYKLFEYFIEENLINESKVDIQLIFQEGIINIINDNFVDLKNTVKIEREYIVNFRVYIQNLLWEINQEQLAVYQKNKLDEAIMATASDPDKLIGLLQGREQITELFQYVSPEEFVQAIGTIKDNCKLITLRNAFIYRSEYINTTNTKEKSIVYERMGEQLQKMIQEEDLQPLRRHNLKTMLNSIRKIEQDLMSKENELA
ncbi:P-loop NTPase fold protein [Paenibacillus sp. 481]|uniref:P-loop NTPase fold protein n=1 Tax=Paenibacillus sp. 481 TaxID=2835869 RepID=UPI001E33F201|nr:P-loop NTPase fold protein [Paenibacillus sp. 481]UHA75738.1 hypothetical protein KIK04_00135 [Paenibacillus sp. 481]